MFNLKLKPFGWKQVFNLFGKIGLLSIFMITIAVNYPPILTQLAEKGQTLQSLVMVLAAIVGLTWFAMWEPKN